MVGMAIGAVRTPADHRLRMELRDLLPDALCDLLLVGASHAAVGVVPELNPADGEGGRCFLQLSAADLREIFFLRAKRFAGPAGSAAGGADQVHRDTGTRVPPNQPAP